jgi:hypothetical protein
MYIKLFRLVDGAHVIGKREEHFIKDALQITMTPEEVVNENGEKATAQRIGLVPMLYPFQVEHKGTNIDISNSMCSIDCPNELLNVYMQVISETQSMAVPTLEPVTNTQQGPL